MGKLKRMGGAFNEPSEFGVDYESARDNARQRVAPRQFTGKGEDYVRNTFGIDLSVLDAPAIDLAKVERELAEVARLEEKMPLANAIAGAYQKQAAYCAELAQLQEATGKAALSAAIATEKSLDSLESESAKVLGDVAIHRVKTQGDRSFLSADQEHKYGKVVESFRDRVSKALAQRQTITIQAETREAEGSRAERYKAIAAFAAGKGDTGAAINAIQWLKGKQGDRKEGGAGMLTRLLS